jgi:hypothetical protein
MGESPLQQLMSKQQMSIQEKHDTCRFSKEAPNSTCRTLNQPPKTVPTAAIAATYLAHMGQNP